MRTKLPILALVLVLVIVSCSSSASAHVTLQDTSRSQGGVLHISPNDDPIAGQESELFFDITPTDKDPSSYIYQLSIRNETTNSTDRVAINRDGFFAASKYTFPTQGTYTLILFIESKDNPDQSMNFTFDQTVSRGASTAAASSSSPQRSGTGMLILGAALLFGALLLAIGIKYRRRIVKADEISHT